MANWTNNAKIESKEEKKEKKRKGEKGDLGAQFKRTTHLMATDLVAAYPSKTFDALKTYRAELIYAMQGDVKKPDVPVPTDVQDLYDYYNI